MRDRGGRITTDDEAAEDSDEPDDLPEILPVEIQGWMLLNGAGLDAGERASVMASAHNSLKLPDVEAALRTQWSESDIELRDN